MLERQIRSASAQKRSMKQIDGWWCSTNHVNPAPLTSRFSFPSNQPSSQHIHTALYSRKAPRGEIVGILSRLPSHTRTSYPCIARYMLILMLPFNKVTDVLTHYIIRASIICRRYIPAPTFQPARSEKSSI